MSHRSLAVVLLVLSLALSGCSAVTGEAAIGADSPGRTATTTTTTTRAGSPATEAGGDATTTVPTTTAATTTTTTLPPVPVVFDIVTRPVAADVVLETSTGETISIQTPFSGELPSGKASAVFTASGRNAVATEFEVAAGGTLELWLDRDGQLLSKVTEFDTAGAPKQVAFTPDGSELWVTLLSGTGFQVFSPLTGELIAAVDLPEAGSVEVIFDSAGDRAFISQMETASVYEVDVASHTVTRTFDTKSSWTKVMVLSPDEETLYASNWLGDDVSVIDLESGETVRRISTVDTPRGLYVTPDGAELYVAGFEDGDIEVIDLATGESRILWRSGGAMRHFAADPAGGRLYASDMGEHVVLSIDLATDEVVELAAVDKHPNTIDIDPDGRVLYVSNRGQNNPETYLRPGPEWGSIVLVDTASGEYLDAIVGGNQPTGLDVSPDGSLLAYSDFLDNRVSVYRIPPYEVLAAGDGGRWDQHLIEIRK